MTEEDVNAMAGHVVEAMKRVTAPLQKRLRALEQDLAALKAKPHVKFCGVWKAGATYAPGDAAVHHGALWIAKAETSGEPSKDYVGWQLAVKRGSA